MIRIREYEREEDYPLIQAWWRKRGAAAPPAHILRLGRIAEHDGVPVAAAFLYLDATGSGCAWLGWMITDADVPELRGGRAMAHLIACLERVAAGLDYALVWGTLQKDSFIRFLENRGYTPADTGLTHLFKLLTTENHGNRS